MVGVAEGLQSKLEWGAEVPGGGVREAPEGGQELSIAFDGVQQRGCAGGAVMAQAAEWLTWSQRWRGILEEGQIKRPNI